MEKQKSYYRNACQKKRIILQDRIKQNEKNYKTNIEARLRITIIINSKLNLANGIGNGIQNYIIRRIKISNKLGRCRVTDWQK